MKQLHRKDLYCWSEFNTERNMDFHSILWVRAEGNVLFDPLPMSAHDLGHLRQLGGAKLIIVTNSDHCRDSFHLAKIMEAEVLGPIAEKANFPFPCNDWIEDNQEVVPGLKAYQLEGSKTPGELAFVLGGDTLITGDLVRSQMAGELCLLPEPKLSDVAKAKDSVRRLASLPGLKTVLVGDGWQVFNGADLALSKLVQSF